jgi:hypothetical protein
MRVPVTTISSSSSVPLTAALDVCAVSAPLAALACWGRDDRS